jgi:hypothetical protein
VAACEIKLLQALTGLEAERIFMLRAVSAMNAMSLSIEHGRVMLHHGNSGADNSAAPSFGKIKPDRAAAFSNARFDAGGNTNP